MEYILPFRMMRRILRINFLLILLSTNPPNSQPDNRFLPFDWIQYRFSGSITSLSEGYSYLYIGTETGGIKRYNGSTIIAAT